MSRPTHLLRHEHRVIEQVLRALDGICLRLRAGEEVPREELSPIVEFLRHFAGEFHHGREEALLFPELARLGIRDEGGALGMIRKEHEVEQRLMAELESAIAEHDSAPTRFADAGTRFTEHLIRHIQEEDAVLFRLAEEMMSEADKMRLFQALKDVPGNYSRYEAVAATLERRWAI